MLALQYCWPTLLSNIDKKVNSIFPNRFGENIQKYCSSHLPCQCNSRNSLLHHTFQWKLQSGSTGNWLGHKSKRIEDKKKEKYCQSIWAIFSFSVENYYHVFTFIEILATRCGMGEDFIWKPKGYQLRSGNSVLFLELPGIETSLFQLW